jgi:hypothetical protein
MFMYTHRMQLIRKMNIFKNNHTLKLEKRLDEVDEKIRVIYQNMDIIWNRRVHRSPYDQVYFPKAN